MTVIKVSFSSTNDNTNQTYFNFMSMTRTLKSNVEDCLMNITWTKSELKKQNNPELFKKVYFKS